MPDHSFSKEILPNIQSESPLTQLHFGLLLLRGAT